MTAERENHSCNSNSLRRLWLPLCFSLGAVPNPSSSPPTSSPTNRRWTASTFATLPPPSTTAPAPALPFVRGKSTNRSSGTNTKRVKPIPTSSRTTTGRKRNKNASFASQRNAKPRRPPPRLRRTRRPRLAIPRTVRSTARTTTSPSTSVTRKRPRGPPPRNVSWRRPRSRRTNP